MYNAKVCFGIVALGQLNIYTELNYLSADKLLYLDDDLLYLT